MTTVFQDTSTIISYSCTDYVRINSVAMQFLYILMSSFSITSILVILTKRILLMTLKINDVIFCGLNIVCQILFPVDLSLTSVNDALMKIDKFEITMDHS